MQAMKTLLILWTLLLAAALPAAAQQPLYIVNGKVCDDIEQVESLPADEETIARYGAEASNGVILVTLRYDSPARFPSDSTFGSYIARRVEWDPDEVAARVVLRYRIAPDGTLSVVQELQSTDNRLKRRVLKAVSEAPRWEPAMKNGQAIESEGVLSIQLPEGKPLPRHMELVIR